MKDETLDRAKELRWKIKYYKEHFMQFKVEEFHRDLREAGYPEDILNKQREGYQVWVDDKIEELQKEYDAM